MPVQVTHNNKGHFYRIAIDIAKEGSELWDLTPYVKGRVGDNRFGLQIVWFYQGRKLDVTNMTPFIRGNVGHYSFDELKNLQMDPDADVVTSHGDPNDCGPDGEATYYFPEQMFPKDGIFKGFIGLESNDGDKRRLTGVNIWFSVLPNVANMGKACDFYVDVLDKTIANFNEKIRQQGIQFETVLNQELQKEKDLIQQKLDAASDAIDDNIASLKKLASAVGAVQAQIDAGNVVTLLQHNADLNKVSKTVENKLAQLDLQPEAFLDENALKAKYPNGNPSLMLTVDTGHKWLWIDGTWKDCGVYQAAGVVGLDSIKDLGKLKKIPVTGINTVAGTDKPIVFKATGKPEEVSSTNFFGDEASAAKLYIVDDAGIYGNKVIMEATYTIDQPIDEDAYLQLSQIGIPDWGTYLTLNGPKLAGTYTIKQVVTLPELSTIDPTNMPAFQGRSVNYTGTVTINNFRISYCDPGEPDSKPVSKMAAGEAIQQGFVGLQNQLDHLNLDNIKEQDELSKLTAPNISVVDKGDKAIVFHGTGILGENSITNFSGTADDVNQYRIANTSVFGQRAHMRVTYAVDQPVGAGYIQMQLAGNPDWSSYLTLSGMQYTGGSYTIEGTYNLPALTNNDFVVFQAVANNYTGNIRITNFNIWVDETPKQDAISNMNVGDRIAAAFRSTMQLDNITNRKQLDDVQIIGANLDVNSNQDWVEEQFTGWNGVNYHSFTNLKPNTNYTYLASLMSDSGDHKWTCLVQGIDSNGNATQIGFNNAPAVANNPEAQVWGQFNTGDYVEIRCYPYLADGIMPVTTIKYRYEMMIEGTYTSMAYKPPYRQYLTTPEALSDMFMSLQSQVDRLNERHLGLPIINLGGKANQAVAADGTYTVPYVFIDKNRKQSGYATISWQGDSSKDFLKKSLKFKTFKDSAGKQKQKWQPTPTFYKSHSFTLKGYYNDKYGFRDSVSAAIQARFVMNNPTVPKELLAANNFGSIQSYPVLLYVDGQFYGLMQLNTKSSSDLWNIDEDNPNQIAMEANGKANKTGALWTHEQISVGENGDFALNSDNDTNAQVNAQKLDTFLVTSTDDDFKAHLDEYVDVNSICDYIIFNFYVNNCDAFKAKNTNYLTYDGNRWYMIGYDFDASLGNSWEAGKIIPADDQSAIEHNEINLLKRIIKLMPEKILARLNDLERNNVFDISTLTKLIDTKANQIGTGAYLLDENRWGNNSEYSIDISIDDIKAMLVTRKALLRKYVEGLQPK